MQVTVDNDIRNRLVVNGLQDRFGERVKLQIVEDGWFVTDRTKPFARFLVEH